MLLPNFAMHFPEFSDEIEIPGISDRKYHIIHDLKI